MKYLSIVALMVAAQAHAQLPEFFVRPAPIEAPPPPTAPMLVQPTPDPYAPVKEDRLMIFDEDDHIMIVDLDTGDYVIILKDER